MSVDNPDRPLQEMKKSDWVEVAKFCQRYSEFKSDAIAQALDCGSGQASTLYRDMAGKFGKLNYCLSLPKFLAEKNITVEKICNMGDYGYTSVREEDLPVGVDKFEKAVTSAVYFVKTSDGMKLIIELNDEFRHDRLFEFIIHFHPQHSSEVKKLAEELDAYALLHSPYRGGKIDPELNFINLSKSFVWDDVILPQAEKTEIIKNVDNLLNSLEIYKANNINFKRGLILKGVPGTGKTMIGKVLCSTTACTFLWVTPKHLEVSKQVNHICMLARELSPTILFLEDIDLYSEDRNSNSNASLLGELMNQLDGLVENKYVIVIATTNKPEKIEEALKNRPGRFDRLIDVPPPDLEGRKKMLNLYVQPYVLDKDVDLDAIAELADGYTGSHIKELVNTAAIDAIDEKSLTDDKRIVLKMKFFKRNIKKVKEKKVTPTMGFGSASPAKRAFPLDED